MISATTQSLIGTAVDRVDGPLKVQGAAPYPNDFTFPDLAHGALVRSTVPAGTIINVETAEAIASPGVLAIITHENTPRMASGPSTILGAPIPPMQDNRVRFWGQPVAVVVAETNEEATAAARLISVEYDRADALLSLDDSRASVTANPWGTDARRGDADAAFEAAEVRFEATYTTPDETNNPLGLFTTVAFWDGDNLIVHDSTQFPYNVRATLAANFGIDVSKIRVLAPYVGGGFGAGLRPWAHVTLAALAARQTRRPVKIVLTRPQMFTLIGHRPCTIQSLKIGATKYGIFQSIVHESIQPVGVDGYNFEAVTGGAVSSYACPNLRTEDRQVSLNVPNPGSMRAPGEAQGNFALECAVDELAHQLGVDPLELRLRNYAEVHPESNLPWSSKSLRECYEVGAQHIGWTQRSATPRAMRDGRILVGYGMAGVTYGYYQAPCDARVTIYNDGRAYVRSAATDIGTGTYTIMAQLSAQTLGLPMGHVKFDLGDTEMPMSAQAGGSGLTGALGCAIYDACRKLIQRFLELAAGDSNSPLRGCRFENVVVADGRILRSDDLQRGETYVEMLERNGLQELTADGNNAPMVTLLEHGNPHTAAAGAFGAKFVIVHVDEELGLIRVERVVSVIDGGTILNEKTARSQIIGGTVGGIGMALLEETVTDADTGRVANATFGDYLVPVNADIPDMDVVFVGGGDSLNPIGTKGIGEIGLIGVAAAIANAVFHATGKRIRSLPITLEQVLD